MGGFGLFTDTPTINTSNQNGWNQSGDQTAALGLAAAQARGNAPSPADYQMRAGLLQAQQAAQAQAASTRGNFGLAGAQKNAQVSQAGLDQQAINSAAQLRAQEQSSALQNYLSGAGQARGQDIQGSQIAAQEAIAQGGLAGQANAANQQASGAILGGILNAGSSLLGGGGSALSGLAGAFGDADIGPTYADGDLSGGSSNAGGGVAGALGAMGNAFMSIGHGGAPVAAPAAAMAPVQVQAVPMAPAAPPMTQASPPAAPAGPSPDLLTPFPASYGDADIAWQPNRIYSHTPTMLEEDDAASAQMAAEPGPSRPGSLEWLSARGDDGMSTEALSRRGDVDELPASAGSVVPDAYQQRAASAMYFPTQKPAGDLVRSAFAPNVRQVRPEIAQVAYIKPANAPVPVSDSRGRVTRWNPNAPAPAAQSDADWLKSVSRMGYEPTPTYHDADVNANLVEPPGVNKSPAKWTLREEPSFIAARNQRTGETKAINPEPLTPQQKREVERPHGAGPIDDKAPGRVHATMGAAPQSSPGATDWSAYGSGPGRQATSITRGYSVPSADDDPSGMRSPDDTDYVERPIPALRAPLSVQADRGSAWLAQARPQMVAAAAPGPYLSGPSQAAIDAALRAVQGVKRDALASMPGPGPNLMAAQAAVAPPPAARVATRQPAMFSDARAKQEAHDDGVRAGMQMAADAGSKNGPSTVRGLPPPPKPSELYNQGHAITSLDFAEEGVDPATLGGRIAGQGVLSPNHDEWSYTPGSREDLDYRAAHGMAAPAGQPVVNMTQPMAQPDRRYVGPGYEIDPRAANQISRYAPPVATSDARAKQEAYMAGHSDGSAGAPPKLAAGQADVEPGFVGTPPLPPSEMYARGAPVRTADMQREGVRPPSGGWNSDWIRKPVTETEDTKWHYPQRKGPPPAVLPPMREEEESSAPQIANYVPPAATSDARAKQMEYDHGGMAAARQFLDSLEPHTFTWADKSVAPNPGAANSPNLGVYAQQVERSPWGKAIVQTDPQTGYKTLDHSALLGALAASAGSQKKIEDDHARRIEMLERAARGGR